MSKHIHLGIHRHKLFFQMNLENIFGTIIFINKGYSKFIILNESSKLNMHTSIYLSISRSDEEHFDVITVSSFLHRPTFRSLIQSLKPNGILYYQTLIKVF